MNLSSDKMDGRDLPITQTRISASEWNQLVASCMAIIQAAELTPDSEDGQQLLNAIKTVVAPHDLDIQPQRFSVAYLVHRLKAQADHPLVAGLSDVGQPRASETFS